MKLTRNHVKECITQKLESVSGVETRNTTRQLWPQLVPRYEQLSHQICHLHGETNQSFRPQSSSNHSLKCRIDPVRTLASIAHTESLSPSAVNLSTLSPAGNEPSSHGTQLKQPLPPPNRVKPPGSSPPNPFSRYSSPQAVG